jgi:acyl-CoA synthetase (NDP forming)
MIDVDVADLMAYFDGDEGTDVVGLYIEGLTNGRKFINAARRMRKPVVITKGGRSHAGGAATVSHTGSIAGDYEVARAVFSAAGLVEAETIEEFADYVKAFAFLKGRAAKGRRVAIISNAGGLGVLAADAAEGTCLEMAKFGGATVEKVAAEAGGYVVIGNPVDLGPGVTDEGFVRAAGHLVEDAGVDALVLLPGIQPYAMRPENLVDGIIELHGRCDVPMVVGITPAERRVPLFDKLESARIPHYDTPERAVRSLAAYVSYHTAR